jgi:peroxin-5
VQVALAVLLNTTEDYAKAVDCFLTALAIRPDDSLLYNRVGATMANNGQAADALEYYLRALDLNPAYIRARFNLGISCINLQRYDEAASHILDALVLQDSDGVEDGTGMNDSRGVTSSTLWESLKTTCLHLQRADLASMCDRRDLDGFRRMFHEV